MGTYDTRGGTPRHDPMFDCDPPCGICGKDPAGDPPNGCECPECPVCGTVGDPKCYHDHGLKQPEGFKGLKCPACDMIFNREPIEDGPYEGMVTCPFCESFFPKKWAEKLNRFEKERGEVREKIRAAKTEEEIKEIKDEFGTFLLNEELLKEK